MHTLTRILTLTCSRKIWESVGPREARHCMGRTMGLLARRIPRPATLILPAAFLHRPVTCLLPIVLLNRTHRVARSIPPAWQWSLGALLLNCCHLAVSLALLMRPA